MNVAGVSLRKAKTSMLHDYIDDEDAKEGGGVHLSPNTAETSGLTKHITTRSLESQSVLRTNLGNPGDR